MTTKQQTKATPEPLTDVDVPIGTSVIKAGENHPALARRGITADTFKVLRESIFPGASNNAILLALDWCRARELDPLMRSCHIVKVWSKEAGGLVETVWPSIHAYRVIAARTREYAGKDAPVYGTERTETFDGVTVTFPDSCELTVYRYVHGQRVPFTSIVFWEETYATKTSKTSAPNDMWCKRTKSQLLKCAEAEALRGAFPEAIGDLETADEMEGQAIGAEPAPPRPRKADFEGAKVIEIDATEEPPETPQESVKEEPKVQEREPPKATERPSSVETGYSFVAPDGQVYDCRGEQQAATHFYSVISQQGADDAPTMWADNAAFRAALIAADPAWEEYIREGYRNACGKAPDADSG